MGIRQNVVDYMKKRSAYFEIFFSSEWDESWDLYLERMSRSSVYGGNLELAAFASAYQLDVVVYQADLRYVITPIDESKGETKVDLEEGGERPNKVHIAYHTWEHYSSVRCSTGPHTGLPGITNEYLKSYVPSGSDLLADPVAKDVGEWKIKQLRESLPFEVPDQVLIKVLNDIEDVGEAVDYFLENGIPEETEASADLPPPSEQIGVADEVQGSDPKESEDLTERKETSGSKGNETTKPKKDENASAPVDKKAARAQKATERRTKREAKARELAAETETKNGGKRDKGREKKEKQKARKREKKGESKTIHDPDDNPSQDDYKVVMV